MDILEYLEEMIVANTKHMSIIVQMPSMLRQKMENAMLLVAIILKH